MTNQEIFDKVVSHLRKQNKQAVGVFGATICQYHGPDGLKCAVGCLIPDEFYDPSFEGVSIQARNSPLHPLLLKLGYTEAQLIFLVELQCVHDEYYPSGWEDCFKRVAATFNLEVPMNISTSSLGTQIVVPNTYKVKAGTYLSNSIIWSELERIAMLRFEGIKLPRMSRVDVTESKMQFSFLFKE